MTVDKIAIHFTVNYKGESYSLESYEGEYRNLMVLLYDKIYIEGFGDCKGMGRCGTCAIKIQGLPPALEVMERNEESTLAKMGMDDNGARLACQLLVDESLENVTIEIIGDESAW